MPIIFILFLAVSAFAENNNGSLSTYGKELPIVAKLDIGPCMDVTICGKWAYFIGQGKLHVADISEPVHPRITGTLAGLGNTRQIVVTRDVAYVSSRADGLFVISVKDPTAPKLLCHYDSIEWATGLAISGDILFIACRNFGVELVDISNPQKPSHLSTVRTGEAQSVVARNGWLYTGVWATSEIVVADIHNPRQPRITARVSMDGYGDGVDVQGNFLFAATGHHSRAPHKTDSDPGFGCGHGLEIFDISDPAKPVFVSRVKFPKLYQLGNDMWSVTISGKYAFVADTYNGIFVVDVSDPRKPFFVAHRQLPLFDSSKLPKIRPNGEIEPLKQQPNSKSQTLPGFVGGLALVQNHIYAAGGWTDLHIIAASDLAYPPTEEIDTPPLIPPFQAEKEEGYRRYRPEGQVYAVDLLGDSAVAACGSAGIHVVQIWPKIKPLATYSTDDFATDTCVLNNMVFVAEGTAGLSLWEVSPTGKLKITGRYHVKGQRIRHVVVPSPGKYALVQVGEALLHIVDVSNPAEPKLMLKDSHVGLLYGNQIMNGLIDNRYAAVFWHVSGLHWYDLYGGPTPVYAGQNHENRFSAQNGVVVFRNQIITTRRNGYVVFDRQEKQSLDELPLYRIKDHQLAGKTTIFQNQLYTANRDDGRVSLVNISDPASPVLLDSFVTDGNPGRIIAKQKGFLVPDGYNGLLVYNKSPSSKQEDLELKDQVKKLCRDYLAAFVSPKTDIAYGLKINGPKGTGVLASPDEVRQGLVHNKPMPYGYGAGIEDVALHNGHLLFALCDAYEATKDPYFAEVAKRMFSGIKLIGTISPVSGFVPRGPHPDDMKSYYTDSSLDQHTTFVYALWRYNRSELVTPEDKVFIRQSLANIGKRLESNDWFIRVEDGSRVAHVGFSWLHNGMDIGAGTLLAVLAAIYEVTGDPHWNELYEKYGTERNGFRWKLMDADGGERQKLTLYSNQFALRDTVLSRIDKTSNHQTILSRRWNETITRNLNSDVFKAWRRMDWAIGTTELNDESAEKQLNTIGLSIKKSVSVFEIWNSYKTLPKNDQHVGWVQRLCVRIPMGAFHAALLSGRHDQITEVAQNIREILKTLDFNELDSGETYYLAVVLGLHLVALQSQ